MALSASVHVDLDGVGLVHVAGVLVHLDPALPRPTGVGIRAPGAPAPGLVLNSAFVPVVATKPAANCGVSGLGAELPNGVRLDLGQLAAEELPRILRLPRGNMSGYNRLPISTAASILRACAWASAFSRIAARF